MHATPRPSWRRLAVATATAFGVVALAASPGLAAIRPAGEMPVTVPVTPGATPASDDATVAGWVQINDDVSADPLVSCTGSLANQRGGITRVEIVPGTSASGAVSNTALTANKIQRAEASGFSSGADTVSYSNAYWNTFGRDRGSYTIKPTYFSRLPSLPCAKGTTTTAGPTGPIGGSCPDTRLVSYVTALTLVGAFPVVQCAPLNALGAAVPGSPITVTVDNHTELVLSPGEEQSTQFGEVRTFTATATLRSAHTNLNAATKPVIAGKAVLFELDGPGGYTVGPVVTNASGVATAEITTEGLSAGVHRLTASFTEDSAWRGSISAPTTVKLADNTLAPVVTAPATVVWDEDFTVDATVTGTGGDLPESGLMRFAFGTEQVDVAVDAGAATHTFRATPQPGAHTVSVKYLGDEIFNASPVTQSPITVEVRPTTLTYDGPASARWGEQIELAATLVDTLKGSALDGRPVTFTIGTQTLTATTDETGRATASVPATSDVGSYDASASYLGNAFYGASTATQDISVDFRHYFASNGEKIGLNPATRQFNYKATGSPNTGIIQTPGLFSVFLPTDVNYQGLPELPSVPADQIRDNATYVPGGTPVPLPELPELPDLPAFPAAGSPESPTAENAASNPVPAGGFTLGQLITRLASGDYPTDVTACEALTRSDCERRLAVLVHQQPGFVLVGVFDLKTGAFSAYKVDALGALPFSAYDALQLDLPTVPTLETPTLPTPEVPALPELPTSEVPGAPAAPALPAPGTLAAYLVDQINTVGAAGALTPAQLAEQVLTVDVPTPQGGTEQVTTTLQGLLDRFAGTTVFDPSNTGISETPEINAGSMMHTASFTRLYGGKSVPKGSARPFATKAEGEALLPKYTVTTSDYVPATPLVPGINPAILVPTGTVPVEAPEGVVPPGAKNPLLAIHWGGKLINVQGSGWDVSGADPAQGITSQSGTGAHTGGDSALGTSIDTAPRTTDGLADPWPIHVPLYTSNGAIPDRSIDFLGFGLPIAVATCIDLGSFTILNTTTYLGMACLSVNILLADGVAQFNGNSPVNLKTDLEPLWSTPPPAVSVASAAIAGAVALLPSTTSLLGTATGLVPALPAVPSTDDPLAGGTPTVDPVIATVEPVVTTVDPVIPVLQPVATTVTAAPAPTIAPTPTPAPAPAPTPTPTTTVSTATKTVTTTTTTVTSTTRKLL